MRATGICLIVVVAFVVSALAACSERPMPGFPHRAHLTSEHCGGVDQPPCPTCATCHGGIRVSEERGLPPLTECRACHGDDTERLFAQIRPASVRRTPIIFDHRAHLALDAIAGQCIGCHGGVAYDGRQGGVYPAMATCTTCHDDALDRGECAPCHAAADLRELVPETFLRHDTSFMRNHGREAARRPHVCSQCHSESQCAGCHDERQPLTPAQMEPLDFDSQRIHRGDFVVRHPIEAHQEAARCLSCHSADFCDGCHVERGVSAARVDAINPHPIGWVGPDPTSPFFHGRDARRDIVACASCHDQGPATNCIRCHSVGGPGGNPHPSGWRSARTPSDMMCSYCHVP